MISITATALARLDTPQNAEDSDGLLLQIRWDPGDADNLRGTDGKNTWIHTPPRGWQVDVFGESLEALSNRPRLQHFGHRVFVQAWPFPNPPFPGGVIDIEGGAIVFKSITAGNL
jgi:hypothetical protein